VRIPLDYYQILGVPESDLSGLEQAYQDRLLQLPQQEYSAAAIESRKRLITVAYQVLSDPLQRSQYIATQIVPAVERVEQLATSPSACPAPFYYRPELEIATEHFLGGLLILFELGEYEEINSICMPHLGNNGRSSNSGSLHPHPPLVATPSGNLPPTTERRDSMSLQSMNQTANGPQIVPLKPDLILAMVSSFWELGEREWRDGCYEQAVIHYETAKKILVQEDLFPQIQGELDRRLDRLRPYRISSLVSLPFERQEQRRQGIQFLEELLENACTNEVKCQERFALNSETTIPFIHETLPHLTAAEQRNLFSQSARKSPPSGAKALNVMQLACTYLHVHALIVQGFAYRNPQSIYTAQQILQYQLSQRIDVKIEQSICALLLGQTEEANQILTTATESAALLAIRQQSQGLPNLLRGLCWYIESWLKDEAFPCFRDLTASDPSLEAYFNDRDVQDFADRVPTSDVTVTNWMNISPQLIDVPPSGDLSGTGYLDEPDYHDLESAPTILPSRSGSHGNSSLNAGRQAPADRLGECKIDPAVRVDQTPPPPPPEPTPSEEPDEQSGKVIQLERERKRRRSQPTARTIDGHTETDLEEWQPAVAIEHSSQLIATSKAGKLAQSRDRANTLVSSRRTRRKPNIPRILLVGTGGVTCLWGALWLADAGIKSLTSHPVTRAVPTALPSPRTSVPNPNLGQSSPTPQPAPAVSLLTTDVAEQVVKTWLSAKTKSMNQEYQTAQLSNILAEPALSGAIDRAQTAKTDGVHWQYKHPTIGISSIAQANPQANTASIEAQVEEDAQYYEGVRLNPDRSYSKQLLVRYDLVRQKDRWYIKDMGVIK
jgi:curved DNA-binding protein CbpA